MRKFMRLMTSIFRLASFAGVLFVGWKIVRRWHEGLAQKTGHVVDTTVKAAAEKLEQTAVALEEWAINGNGEHFGKDLDNVLMDTKKTLDAASGLMQGALNHSK